MSQINKVIAFNSAWSFLITQSVIVPFLTFRQLTIHEIFLLQAIHALIVCIFDIPSSYIADKYGKLFALYCGCFLRAIGGVLFCFANGFDGFVLTYLFIGIGNAFAGGANIAVLYDIQTDLKNSQSQAEKVLGKNYFFTKFSIVASALIGGIAAQYSFDLLAWINAVTATLPLLILLTMKKVPNPKGGIERHKFSELIKLMINFKGDMRRFLFSGILYGVTPFLGQYISQAIFVKHSLTLVTFGCIMAANQVFTAFFSRSLYKIRDWIGPAFPLFLLGIFPVLAFYAMSTDQIALVIVALILIEICRGLNEVVVRGYVNKMAVDHFRSSINSLITFGTYLVLFILSLYIGKLINQDGLMLSLHVLAYMHLAFMLIVVSPLVIRAYRNQLQSETAGM